MFTTPRKQKQQHNTSSMDAKEYHNSPQHKSLININANTPIPTTSTSTTTNTITPIVFENGTMFGAISPDTTNNSAKLSVTSSDNTATYLTIPEIVISASSSSNTLNRSRCEISQANSEESAMESTALLEATTTTTSIIPSAGLNDNNDEPAVLQDEFDQFILNRTTSESNILESSIYSELQFPPSLHGGSILAINSSNVGSGGGYVSGSGGPTVATQIAGPQTPPHTNNARQTKRTKRKHKTKSKCTATAATLAAAASQRSSPTHYPPRYTAIFMDAHHHHHAQQYGNVMTASQHHSGGGAANALGQIASAAASSPFLNAPVATDTAAYMQQFQYFQQRPMVTTMSPGMAGHHRHHRSLFDGATATTAGIENPLNLHHTSATTAAAVPAGGGITPPIRLSFRKWFSRPSLPFVIGILALGGVACTLGGIVLGSTGLIEHSTQYLSAALLMIGIGVSLLVISGAIWRLSLPDDVDECPCYRHMEMCRNCNSPYCNSRLMGGNYLYPEFQHRPPPPSYLTSLNECAGMSLLFHPTASAPQAAAYSTLRVNTPPPLYRSTNSLSVYATPPPPPASHSLTLTTAGQHHTAANTTTIVPNLPPSSVGIVPDHSVISMSNVMENLQVQQSQPLIKEFNYLELD
ncbi:uncharacterized protein LOC119611274 [Lucilia sericata]|uniref:uncharacterized protein LOC119611274 n=1 Tax=Lucilia sericata TaxID=13632 RepID=UPI0018A82812|nr:uncharacterized protein LOC119611274 [Lucilia sericata]